MFFSVVIPLYNKEKYIERAVCSVLAQSQQDFEVLVINDGSIDRGPDIIRNIKDPRIKLVSQNNSGVSAARNKGIELATSEIVAFLDADDEWCPQHLESIMHLRNRHKNAGIYTTTYQIFNGDERIENPAYRVIPKPPWQGILPSYFKAAAYGAPPVCSSVVCIPKKVFSNVGFFEVGKRLGEDIDMWMRIAFKYPVAFSWTHGAIYRKDSVNRACLTKPIIESAPFKDSIERMTLEIRSGNLSKKMRNDLEKYIAKLQIEAAKYSFYAGGYFDAIQYLKKVPIFEPVLWYALLDTLCNKLQLKSKSCE